MEHLEELKRLAQFVIKVDRSEISPQLKFELIFCDEISGVINNRFSLGELYGYYDPDTDYAEDVRAYADAVRLLLADLNMIDAFGMTWTR